MSRVSGYATSSIREGCVYQRALSSVMLWRTEFANLGRTTQTEVQHAYRYLEGEIEPGEILLAVALKKSLRSGRLYQPLYEANIMQLLLEGQLHAPVSSSKYTRSTTSGPTPAPLMRPPRCILSSRPSATSTEPSASYTYQLTRKN